MHIFNSSTEQLLLLCTDSRVTADIQSGGSVAQDGMADEDRPDEMKIQVHTGFRGRERSQMIQFQFTEAPS